jgi:TRAP-type uncharacterized transport system substrate-binding protein
MKAFAQVILNNAQPRYSMAMRNRDILGYLALLFLAIGFGAAVYYASFAPHVFRVAVPVAGSEQAQLFSAIAGALRREHTRVRLVVEPFETHEQIVSAIEKDRVDLAVVRTDGPLPAGTLGVAEVHAMVTLLLVRPDIKADSISDLKGKRIGEVTRAAPGQGIFYELLQFNRMTLSDVHIEAYRTPQAMVAAVEEKKLDALLLVVPRGARPVGDLVRAMINAYEGDPKVLPLKEAKAIATRLPAIEAGEIVAGELSANPQIPAEASPTLTFPLLLMVRQKADSNAVQELTRQIFNVRPSLTAQHPMAARLAALDTERGGTFAVHPGAAIYYDASETTLLDRYSDMLWLLLFGFSTIVSAFVWFLRRLFPQQREILRTDHHQLVEMLSEVRTTKDAGVLDAAQARIDEIVARVSRLSFDGKIDQEQKPAFELIIERIEKVIEDRRRDLSDS